MKFTNEKVRRQDRLLAESEALALLRGGEYGFLAMAGDGGGGYGLPVSYAWDGRESIYIHCAPEGEKLRLLALDNRVTFCVVGRTKVIPDKFTTAYESVLAHCTAHTDLEAEERMRALELIIEKYSPEHRAIGLKYAEKSFHRTAILRLDISTISGKAKREAKP